MNPNYKEVNGNLITLALQGEFDVITHGTNCFCTQGAGIAPLMAKNFGTDKFKMESPEYRGTINKLGTIDYEEQTFLDGPKLTVVNSYTQYGFGLIFDHPPLDYEALTLCLRKINHTFKGKKIGIPQIGCGLAGGVWDVNELTESEQVKFRQNHLYDVKTIIMRELKDCDVTAIVYKKVEKKDFIF